MTLKSILGNAGLFCGMAGALIPTQSQAMVQIDPSAKASLPGLKVFYIMVRGSNNSGEDAKCAAAARTLLAEQCVLGQEKWGPLEPSKIEVIQTWRKRHKQMKSPSKAVCSIEGLIRRIRSGKFPPNISPFVDIYNALSIKYELPMGGEDLRKLVLTGDTALTVKTSNGTEPYWELGQSLGDPAEFPVPGELIYADGGGTVCRSLNWRESARTMLDPTTVDAIFVTEAMGPAEEGKAVVAMMELGTLITTHCGGSFEAGFAE